MNQPIVLHSVRFILIFLIQVVVLNYIEIGSGIQLMIYPLFLFLLPSEVNVFYLMLIAFGLGVVIDVFSNTYGLHASAGVVFAYFRPLVFKLFAPRDGYDALLETNIFNMGRSWFLRSFGLLLLIHHFWFFFFQMFKISEVLYILQQTGLSVVLSFVLCLLFQFLFLRKPKKEI